MIAFFTGDRISQPTYVNMYELANMAAMKAQELHFPPPPPGSSHNEAPHYHSEKVVTLIN